MHRLQTINCDELKNVKLYDFIENKNYKVTLTPYSIVNFGFIIPKWKPYGEYNITEVEYGGCINHGEEYIKELGMVIHDNKVCWPPHVTVYYNDGEEEIIKFSSYEEAKKAHDIIASKIPNAITI